MGKRCAKSYRACFFIPLTKTVKVLQSLRDNAPDTPESGDLDRRFVVDLDVGVVEVQGGRRARVGAIFADKSITVWAVGPEGGFESLWRSTDLTFIPRALQFGVNRRLIVFAETGGIMYVARFCKALDAYSSVYFQCYIPQRERRLDPVAAEWASCHVSSR